MPISSSDLRNVRSGNYKIDALTAGNEQAALYSARAYYQGITTISYGFYAGGTLNQRVYSQPVALDEVQKMAVRQALAQASSVTGLRFVETYDVANADISFVKADYDRQYDYVLGLTSYNWSYGRAFTYTGAYYVKPEFKAAGTVISLNYSDSSIGENWFPGTYAYEALLHEIGHAIGLSHSFDGSDKLPPSEDKTSNTLMSYTEDGTYSTYQSYDRLAFQFLYNNRGLDGRGVYWNRADGMVVMSEAGTNSGGSYTLTASDPRDVLGTSRNDVLTLAAGDCTVSVGAVETITGSAALERVVLGNAGESINVSGIETLVGGSGNDIVTLADGGGALTVSGVETLYGGAGADSVTITAGKQWVRGGDGADTIVLVRNGARDTVAFSTIADGSEDGAASGYDVVTGFEAGVDKVTVGGALLTVLSHRRATSLANEVTVLSSPIASLNDEGFAAFRAAVSGTGIGGMVMAKTATDTGVFLIAPADSNPAITAAEVRLLAVFRGSLLKTSDIA